MGKVQKPRVRRQETAFLSALEVRRPLEVMSEDWHAFFTTAALTGMRLSELLAMRWANLDWETGTYDVRERLYEGHFDSPKTRTHKATQTAHRLEYSPVYKDEGLHFCTDRGTPLCSNARQPPY